MKHEIDWSDLEQQMQNWEIPLCDWGKLEKQLENWKVDLENWKINW